MFRKIESYVTPILLSHVDKYIKDFKAEDTQVSLWNGAVALHNLELRPDIIQEELHLPFFLSSGHIHELLIQVPWMKIISEPILVTINTIECVLTLKTESTSELRNAGKNKNKQELDTPPGYVQSLVNRIVNNISFRCNNLILKYVEEDIVVSVNIKHLSLDSVNGNWEPSFSDMTIDDLHIRKLIRLSDLTLCLDKRNAAGKIETYLEPLLYRCELEIRMDSTYYSLTNQNPKYIRCCISSPKLEISVSYQQIPMLMRLAALFWALKKKHLKISHKIEGSSEQHQSSSLKSTTLDQETFSEADVTEYGDTWAGWAWSLMQPIYYIDEDDSLNQKMEPILLVGVNIENVTMTFKIPESSAESGTVLSKKIRQRTLARLLLTSMLFEASVRSHRFCMRAGLRGLALCPENFCSCSALEEAPGTKYLESTTEVDSSEKLSWPVEYDDDTILEKMTDEEMCAICPAVSVSYTYHLTLPEDRDECFSDTSADLEYSNFKETASMNFVFGPIKYLLCAGLVHRISVIMTAANTYDYAPYYTMKPLLKKHELPPPTTDDYDSMMEFIPKSNIRFLMQKPNVSIAVWDHPTTKESVIDCSSTSLPTRRKTSTASREHSSYRKFLSKIPFVVFEAKEIEGTVSKPMYPNRLTYVISQLPDPPAVMFEACHQVYNLKVNNLQCLLHGKILTKDDKMENLLEENFNTNPSCNADNSTKNKEVYAPIITECTFHIIVKELVLPEYWQHNTSIILNDYTLNIENIAMCSTMPKLLTVYEIIAGAFPNVKWNIQTSVLLTTTLLKDTIMDDEMVHLELNMEGLSLRSVFLQKSATHRIVVNSIKSFAIKSLKENSNAGLSTQTVWVVCAPDTLDKISLPFLKAILQNSSDDEYASFITVSLKEWSFILDPLLCEWLTYKYINDNDKIKWLLEHETSPAPLQSGLEKTPKRSLDDIMNRIGSCKMSNKQTSAQSHSDRERDFVHAASAPSSQDVLKNPEQMDVSIRKDNECTSFSHFTARKVFQWRYMAIYMETECVTVYLPTKSISAVDYQTVHEAIQGSILNDKLNGLENILILRLPSAVIKSSTLKKHLLNYSIYGLPLKLPAGIWNTGSYSYPWHVTLANMSCHTLSKNNKNEFNQGSILKPVSSNVIVSLTPKTNKHKDTSSTSTTAGATTTATNTTSTTATTTVASSLKKVSFFPHHKGHKSSKNENIIEGTSDVNVQDTNMNEEINRMVEKNQAVQGGIVDVNEEESTAVILTTLGVFVHVDTGSVVLSVNRKQMSTLTVITHGLQELINAIRNNKKCVCNKSCNAHLSKGNKILYEKTQSLNTDNNFTTETYSENNLTYTREFRDDSGITEQSEQIIVPPCCDLKLTSWIQWTVSRFTAKCYATAANDNTSSQTTMDIDELNSSTLKLVFDAEDLMTSLDMHTEYLKLKSKMVTANLQHFSRKSSIYPWKLGKYKGIVIRGREHEEPLKQNEENCFIYITLTLAMCSSVYSRWGDGGKKTDKKLVCSKGEFICEIEVCVQSLDVVVSPMCLEPFLAALTPALTPVCCEANFTAGATVRKEHKSITNPAFWNSQNFPLCYFEGHQIRLLIPANKHHLENENSQDVLIIQINKTNLMPIAENPICRRPVRLDLYEAAARDGWLGLPGGPLEDRQGQLTFKGISVHTAQWGLVRNIFPPQTSTEQTLSENPAVRWNNLQNDSASPKSDQLMTIVQNADICVVLALAMFYKSTFVCGPSIDVNLMTDTEIKMSTSQLKLLLELNREFSYITNKMKEEKEFRIERCALEKFIEINHRPPMCPYSEFILTYDCHASYKESKLILCSSSENQIPFDSPRNSFSDTGIVSDRTSSPIFKCKRSTVSLPAVKNENNNVKSQYEYFDGCVTLGKISLIFFDDCGHRPKKNRNVKIVDSKVNVVHSVMKPLLYGMLHQPNFYFSKHNYITNIQMSVFSASLALGGDTVLRELPTQENYPIHLLETKPGVPSLISGILPALLTAKYENQAGFRSTLKININCPVKWTISKHRINKLKQLQNLLSCNTSNPSITVDTVEMSEFSSEIFMNLDEPDDVDKINYSFSKWFGSLNSIDLSISQTVLALKTQDNSKSELLLSFSSLIDKIEINNRLEKVVNIGLIESITMSLCEGAEDSRHVILSPWSIGFELTGSWEPWRISEYSGNFPSIQLLIECDTLIIQCGVKQLDTLKSFLAFWNDNEVMDNVDSVENCNERLYKHPIDHSDIDCYWSRTSLNDQHYKDDLRAGAFKFVKASCNMEPLPYQVILGHRQLLWCYPHPRALTRLHSYPLPFQLEQDGEDLGTTIVCTLEYYSDFMHCFQIYAKFDILPDQVVKLDLPYNNHDMVMATTWRIIMRTPKEESLSLDTDPNEEYFFDKSKYLRFQKMHSIVKDDIKCACLPINPQMLAGFLRVDSYSSPTALPAVQMAIKLSSGEINMYNYSEKLSSFTYADKERRFKLDGLLPPPHVFLKFGLYSTKAYTSLWNKNTGTLKIETNLLCDTLENHDLSLTRALWCRGMQCGVWWGGRVPQAPEREEQTRAGATLSVVRAGIRGGAHLLNTFSCAMRQSDTAENEVPTCDDCANVISHRSLYHKYLLRNDTSVMLKVGQEGSDEGIFLHPQTAHLYGWLSSKYPKLLTIAIQEGDWQSSQGFQMDKCGIFNCELIGEPGLPQLNVIISVEATSPCHRVVTLMGRLTIYNLLNQNLEIKLYQRKCSQRPTASPIFCVKGNIQYPSLFVDNASECTFRVRFEGSLAGWTGDIPLKECPKGNVPWLVKVPVKIIVDDISVWCRVITDPNNGRILVTVFPIYAIRSHFPMPLEITVKSPQLNSAVGSCVLGRGSTQVLTLPGTTDTEHTISFSNRDDSKQLSERQFPLVYNQDQTLIQNSLKKYDVTQTLLNIKEWQEEGTKWPYTSSEDGDFKWTPLHEQYPEEVIVRSNYEIPSIDSVIVEISPWTLFCNCSGVSLTLYDSDKQEMCELKHRTVATPPMSSLNPHFFFGIKILNIKNRMSAPLTISTEESEKGDESNIIINISKTLLIPFLSMISVLSVTHEISNSINVFRFSSNFVIINQTTLDFVVLPVAILVESEGKLQFPPDMESLSILLPGNQNNCLGIPITYFCVSNGTENEIGSSKEIHSEKDYAFFIFLGSSSTSTSFTCPLRIDNFAHRRSLSLKYDDISIPIVVTCKRDKDQTYIAVHRDTSPQLLIQNNADIYIAVGQATPACFCSPVPDQYEKVVEECQYSNWQCEVGPGDNIYYTMPSVSQHFPELVTDSAYCNKPPTSHLMFAYINAESSQLIWSSPVNVNCTSSEQFVKLPGFSKDIKVTVVYHPHSTFVTIDNVTQIDISASEIRSRLSGNTFQDKPLSIQEISLPNIDVSLFEENDPSVTELKPNQELPKEVRRKFSNFSNIQSRSSPGELSSRGHAGVENEASIAPSAILIFLSKSFAKVEFDCLNITLTGRSDVLEQSPTGDIASFTFQQVLLKSNPSDKGSVLELQVREIQVDNPLRYSGGYDFPVVLVNQAPASQDSKVDLKEDSLLICKLELEIWKHSDLTEWGFTEFCISIGPLSAYIEDTYITLLLNYLSEYAPELHHHRCSILQSMDRTPSGVIVAYEIMTEMTAIAQPIYLRNLRIRPLNLLLSLHTNLHVYIALDHSPLQFSAFDRSNVRTTSYRLGHALTMHYLSEAIYRAGWVVGSLEILGCPGGLARRVGAGLRALLAEPCRGLVGNGPWGMLVGVTHGSATLLKNLTQGTVESVSMVMGSVARNLDRLSLDEEHVRRTEAARRARPTGLPQGLARGLKGLALGVLGGAVGLVTSPLASGPSGLTRGLLGAVAKPLSATADLLAFTSQGLLGQVGWDPKPQPVVSPVRDFMEDWQSDCQAWRLRLGNSLANEPLLYICQGIDRDTGLVVALIVTTRRFLVMDLVRDKLQQMVEVGGCRIVEEGPELCIGLQSVLSREESQTEGMWRLRVAAYLGEPVSESSKGEKLLRVRLPHSVSSHLCCVLSVARDQHLGHGFSVI